MFAEVDPYCGVDLDDCVIGDGSPHPVAAEIIAMLDSYTELSPSGAGVHVIVKGAKNGGRGESSRTGWGGAFEVYDRGRFFTFTGRGDGKIADRQEQLDALLARMFPVAEVRPERHVSPNPKAPNLDDRELLDRAYAASNGGKLRALYDGDVAAYGGDHSSADLALCSLLAFWTGPDPARINGLFRSSGLMRDKWDSRRGESTYGAQTIERALADATEFYGERFVQRSTSAQGPAAAQADTAALGATVAIFRRWLHLPDPAALYAVLGAVAANRLPGDPVWLLLVGSPSSGKSEILQAIGSLPDVYPTASLTEGGLLSGTPKREKAKNASGGLLKTIGEYGILLSKDFGSVLSLHHDTRAQVLAALREVYDGSWTRNVGTDGGQTLHWEGKCGLIAGCTPTIDRHSAVMGAMGERFVLLRLSPTDAHDQGRKALQHAKKAAEMRAELSEAVTALFEREPAELPERSEHDEERLVNLAVLAVRCRSAVERDGHSREVELIPEPEAPARLAIVLDRLLDGLLSIGTDTDTAWRVVETAALDSIPALRRKAMIALLAAADEVPTAKIASAIGYPLRTTERTLDDLVAHGVALVNRYGQGKATTWQISEWTAQSWAAATSPEKSGGMRTEAETPEKSGASERSRDARTHTPDLSGEVGGTNRDGWTDAELQLLIDSEAQS